MKTPEFICCFSRFRGNKKKKKLNFCLFVFFFFLGKRKPSTFHFDVRGATSLASVKLIFMALKLLGKKKRKKKELSFHLEG